MIEREDDTMSDTISARRAGNFKIDTEQNRHIMNTMPRTNANPEADPNGPLDVWLRFETCYDDATGEPYDDASHEANTYLTETGYAVKWYNNAVGLVTTIDFDTLTDAYDWYEANGYQDFTVVE